MKMFPSKHEKEPPEQEENSQSECRTMSSMTATYIDCDTRGTSTPVYSTISFGNRSTSAYWVGTVYCFNDHETSTPAFHVFCHCQHCRHHITITSNTAKTWIACTAYGLSGTEHDRDLHTSHTHVYMYHVLTHCTRVPLHDGVLYTSNGTTKSRVVERGIVRWSSKDFEASSLDGATSRHAGGAVKFQGNNHRVSPVETSTVWG